MQILPCTISDELLRTIKSFVYNKYLLDKAVSEDGGVCFIGALHDGSMGPLDGPSFYRAVFPFVPTWERASDRFSAFIPINQSLGCSWKWRNRNLTPELREKYLSFFTDPERANLTGHSYDKADFMWIRPLGLVLPHEGKNRVDFLREQLIEMIPARVSQYDYPPASRIILYRVNVQSKCEYWAVLDDRWVERVNHPSWANPVLAAYGVLIKHQWPPKLPTVQDVSEGFNHPSGNPDFLNNDIVDLEQISLHKVRKHEVLHCSLSDFRALRLRNKSLVWYCMGAVLVSLIIICLIPYSWLIGLGVFVGVLLGFVFGVCVMFFYSLFQTARMILEQDLTNES